MGHLHVGKGKGKKRQILFMCWGCEAMQTCERNPSESERVNLRFSRSISDTLQQHLSTTFSCTRVSRQGQTCYAFGSDIICEAEPRSNNAGTGAWSSGMCFHRPTQNRHIPPSIPDFQKPKCSSRTVLYIPI